MKPFSIWVVVCATEIDHEYDSNSIAGIYFNEAAAKHHAENPPEWDVIEHQEQTWWVEEHEVI
jgi:hypothetical protein